MRHPSSTRRYAEYGYIPKSGPQRNPDIIVNGRGNDSSDSLGSAQRSHHNPHGLEEPSVGKLGIASNPNRAEMPVQNKRKGSYDPVSCQSVCHSN